MKFLAVLVCAFAVTSAGHVLAPVGHAHVYHGPQHLPIINHEGVPVDTADVQIAKAAHLSHKVHVAARNGDLAVGHHVAPVVAHSAVVAHQAPILTHGHHGIFAPIVSAHHGLHYRKRRGIYAAIHHGYHGAQHIPIINHQGVPVDTTEVQIARAAHLAHKIDVHNRNHAYSAHTTYAHAPVVAYAPIVAHHAHTYAAPLVHHY